MAEKRLTSQDLIYASTALRQAARISEKQASDPTFHSSRETFRHAMRVKDELAAKFDRFAKRMRAWRSTRYQSERFRHWISLPLLTGVRSGAIGHGQAACNEAIGKLPTTPDR